jgi:two-component system cell cycle sensor histidine kinase PleC
MIEEVVLKEISKQNVHFANLYQKEIWNRHPKAIEKITNFTDISTLGGDDFMAYLKSSLDFLHYSNAEVIIYNNRGQKVLTNTERNNFIINNYQSADLYTRMLINFDKYLLKDYMQDDALADAYKGQVSHNLISRAIIYDENDDSFEKSFIINYIPIMVTNNHKVIVQAVLEIRNDITQQWNNIMELEKRIFLAFVVTFLIFFAIVMYNTNYAQRIINKQFETNKALEEAKIRAETESSAKTQFLANVSHELRTPLNAIIGFSEIIMAETYGSLANSQYKDYVIDINNSGKHLLSVINDILDFSKASADKLQVDKVELDLNKLAYSSMRFVKPRADKAMVDLIVKIPLEHIIVTADPKRLKQALLNLLSNAVKFTPANGSVTLMLKKDPIKKLVQIIVKDTGIGMSAQDIPKALSSFGQIDSKLNRKYEGTGLGLPMTKKLVELMNGHFHIESKLNKGTKVVLTFAYDDSIEVC